MIKIPFSITQQDIEIYADISGDHNPIHLDEEQAKKHGFSGTIAHGMLTMAKVWSVISSHFLTPAEFPNDYELEFYAPVHAGDTVTLRIERQADRLLVEGVCEDRIVVKGFIIAAD